MKRAMREEPVGHTKTQIYSIGDAEGRLSAVRLLKAGAIIAAPTDTVYGLVCRYDDPNAVEALFRIKQRALDKAIPVLVADMLQVRSLTAAPLRNCARRLVDHFWPGSLTVVLPARVELPSILTAGQPTVALRMPDHDGLLGLLREVGPLAATSANLSGAPAAGSAQAVYTQLAGCIPLILADSEEDDAGEAVASTIVSFAENGRAQILRSGELADDVLAFVDRFPHRC